jgi:hypothetical protein
MVSLVHEALPDGLSVRKRRMGDILMNPSHRQPTFGVRHDRACRIERSPKQAQARASRLWDLNQTRVGKISSPPARGRAPHTRHHDQRACCENSTYRTADAAIVDRAVRTRTIGSTSASCTAENLGRPAGVPGDMGQWVGLGAPNPQLARLHCIVRAGTA